MEKATPSPGTSHAPGGAPLAADAAQAGGSPLQKEPSPFPGATHTAFAMKRRLRCTSALDGQRNDKSFSRKCRRAAAGRLASGPATARLALPVERRAVGVQE